MPVRKQIRQSQRRSNTLDPLAANVLHQQILRRSGARQLKPQPSPTRRIRPWALIAGLCGALAIFAMVAIPNRSILAATFTWTQSAWTGSGELAYADNFERSTLGNNWTVRTGSVSIVNSSDMKGGSSNHNLATFTAASFDNDQWAEITIASMTAGDETHVCVRVPSTGNVDGYCLATDGTFFEIWEMNNLAWGGQKATSATNPVAGDTIRIEAEGTTLRGYLNGQLMMTGSDATYTSGYPALMTWKSSAVPTATIEAFAADDLPYANGTGASHPTNQAGWTNFAVKDRNVTTETTVDLQAAEIETTLTTDTDFSGGTLSNTEVSGTGVAANIQSTSTEGSTPHESIFTSASGAMPFNTLDTDGNLWAVTNGSPYSFYKIAPDVTGTTYSNTCSVGNSPGGIAYDPITPAIWITNGSDRHVCRFNPATGAELSDAVIGASGAIGKIVYDSGNQRMWVINYTLGEVYRLTLAGVVENTYALTTETGLSGGGFNALIYEATTASVFTILYDFDGDTNYLVKKPTNGSAPTTTNISYIGSGQASMTVVTSVPAIWIVDSSWGSARVNATTMAYSAFNPGTSPQSITYDAAHNIVWTGHSVQPYLKKWDTSGSSLGTYNTTYRAGAYDAQYDPVRKRFWSTRGSGGGTWSVTFIEFAASGTFTSAPIAIGPNLNITTADWTASAPTNTTLAVRVRTAVNSNMSDATSWTTCSDMVDGDPVYYQDSQSCGRSGDGYIQYRVSFTTSDPLKTATFSDMTFGHRAFSSGTIMSSPYDTNDPTNVMASLSYSQATSGTVDTGVVVDTFERANLGYDWYDHYCGFTDYCSWAHICNSSDFCGNDTQVWSMAGYLPGQFHRDQFSETTISATGTGREVGPMVRYVESTRYYRYNWYAATTDGTSYFTLWKIVHDGITDLLQLGAPYPTVGDVIRLESIGSTLNVYVNGSLRGTSTDSDLSYGTPGIYVAGTPGQGTGEVEMWRGGNVVTLGGSVRLQARTSADGAAWSSWLGPTGASSYFTTPGGSSFHSSHQDGTNDRYVQYRAELVPASAISVPRMSSVSLSYVVNASPEFESAPTASQDSDGIVNVSFSIRDPDTESGSITRGFVTPTYEYSLNNGGAWNAITTGLSAGATNNKAVEQTDFTTYNITWDAKQQIDGSYASQAMIRVRLNDNEGANNTAFDDTVAFVLDVKDPVLGSPAISVDASVTPADISLNASDDSSFDMCVTLNNTATNCVPYSTTTTVSLATDPDTVYVQFRDAKGNTATANAVTPETPAYMTIRDLSNLDANQYFLFISWKAVATPLPDFSQYEVWHSTNGTSYDLLTPIVDRSINYYLHQNLVDGSTHYYKVTTLDTDGNRSYFSSVVSDAVDGQGGSDATPPTISLIAIQNVTTQAATIVWDTDELSDSSIGYSTTPAVFTNEVGVSSMVDSASGVGRHSVTLTGLTPDTTYYFRVRSTDPGGNSATSDNGGDGFIFATIAGPTISNVTTPQIDNTSVTINWLTNIPADSTIRYSTTTPLTSPMQVTDETEVTNHTIRLTGLTRGTTYYYEVLSGVANDPNGGSYYSFTTTDDSVPPIISDLEVETISDTQAIVRWTTNEPASSQVEYGVTSGSYPESSTTEASLNTLHTVSLTGLTASTTYFLVAHSADSSGNAVTSEELSFATTEPLITETEAQEREDAARGETDDVAPTLSQIAISNVTSTGARVSWTTNESTNSFVRFGASEATSIVVGNWQYVSDHELDMSGLTPSTTYTYRVISADQAGNITESDAATFVTRAASATEAEQFILDTIDTYSGDAPQPEITGQPLVTATSTTATISWRTDVAANALIAFATDDTYRRNGQRYAQIVGDPDTYTTTHQVALENLVPDTLYHYQARSKTRAAGSSVTADFTFRTQKRQFEIENHAINQIDDETAAFRWTTTEPGTSTVTITPYRGNTRAVEELRSIVDTTTTLIHQIEVADLEPSTRYHVELVSTNASNQRATKEIDSFSTVLTPNPPVISRIQVDSALSTGESIKVQSIISWVTDKPSTSRVYWREGVGQADEELSASSPLDQVYTKRHLVVLTAFKPGAVYQLRVESTDSNGQTTLSTPLTILTPQQEQTVFEVIMGAINQAFGWTRLFR